MGGLQIKNAKDKEQSGGKGIGKNCGLKYCADDDDGADNRGHKSGTFGLAVAEKKEADRDPHHADE
jgi:hypothetical protein